MQEVYEFLKKCGTYYLATVEGDQPRVRPFGTVDIFEGRLYIQTGKVKDVSKQLQANPHLELHSRYKGFFSLFLSIIGHQKILQPCRSFPLNPPIGSIRNLQQCAAGSCICQRCQYSLIYVRFGLIPLHIFC